MGGGGHDYSNHIGGKPDAEIVPNSDSKKVYDHDLLLV
jgi:hypothetical protein